MAFDVALHFGTLIAVVWFFRKKGWLFLKNLTRELLSGKITGGENMRLLICLAVATVPGAFAGFFFEDWAEHVFRSPLSVAAMLLIYALLLAAADRFGRKRKSAVTSLKDISYTKAALIGAAQALAIVPGTSRSGVTITAGLLLGYGRKNAAVFSFMLSVPIILGAFLASSRHLFFVEHFDLPMLAAGIISSSVVGFLSIKYMLQYLTNHNYDVFVWYRVILAIVILILNFKFEI